MGLRPPDALGHEGPKFGVPALSKLARNNSADREDVRRLARGVPLDPDRLWQRYEKELRPNLIGDPRSHDLTLEMWIEAYFTV